MEHAQVISNHGVYLLLIELALLIGVTRLGAELFRRLGLPAVVGELGGGSLLGPSVFGRFWPELFRSVFPAGSGQFQLLDVIGTLGMTFLLLLTGLETDVKLVRNLGRAALMTSAAGMVLPFARGFALGQFMPDVYLASPDHRTLFSLFLATTMSISAMPVIAKILVDLDLTKRNIGLVILSAGVVDDTAGWLILSLIAGAATHGSVRVGQLGLTILCLIIFLAFAAVILPPFLRLAIRATVERFRVADSDLALIVATTLACAAVTERIGIHAVFGAFVAGLVLHQEPRLQKDTVARLESFVMSILGTQKFSIIVMMAIVTSFMAPIGLRLTMPRVRMTEDERQRITASRSMGMLNPEHLRVLLPTGGGPNALVVAPVAFGLAQRSSAAVELLWVDPKATWRTRFGRQ